MGPDNDAGTGVIDPGYAGAGAVSLSKQAFAEQRVCHKTEDGWDCNWVGHDIYSLDNLTVEGNGKVSLEKTRRVLSSFTQYDTTIDQIFDPNEIIDISPIPLTTGLDALSPYTISITADNGSIETTNEFDHTWYDFSIDYNYQLNMDVDNVLDIARDPGNMRVLKYFYDENFGTLESLDVNVVFEGDDLPECFKIKSTGACYLPVPEDHKLAELNIIGTNIWDGTSVETLPEITSEMLNPVVADSIDSIFNLNMFDFVLILLVFMLVAYIIYRILRWY